jgi:biotin operon repressor
MKKTVQAVTKTTPKPITSVEALMSRAHEHQAAIREYIDGLRKEGLDIATVCRKWGLLDSTTPYYVRRAIAEQQANRATVKAEVELDAFNYGLLCTAAAVLGVSDWKEALRMFLENAVVEWQNEGFFLENHTYIQDE